MIHSQRIASASLAERLSGLQLAIILRGFLLFLLALTYSGGVQYLLIVSPTLLWAYYAGIGIGIIGLLHSSRDNYAGFRSIAPYIVFLLGYVLWGCFAAQNFAESAADALHLVIYTLLIL